MTTLAYIISTRYVSGHNFIFALGVDSRPLTLCVVKHETYMYVGSKKPVNCPKLTLQGETNAIVGALEEAGIQLVKNDDNEAKCEVLKLNEAEHFNKDSLYHHKIYMEGYDNLIKAKKVLFTQHSFQVKEFPSAEAKLQSDLNLLPCQWIQFDMKNTTVCDFGNRDSKRRPLQLVIEAKNIKPSKSNLPPPKTFELTFDCETFSSRFGQRIASDYTQSASASASATSSDITSVAMPNSLIENDIIYCLSMVFTWSDSNEIIKTKCLCVHSRDLELPDRHLEAEIISVVDERSLQLKFIELINEEDPDIINGYNIFGYDFDYIKARTSIDPLPTFGRLRRGEHSVSLSGTCHEIIIDIPDEETYISKEWEGAGGTWHSYHFPECLGRVLIDTFLLAKKTKTNPGQEGALQSHSLNNVGKFFVKETKEDMPYERTFAIYRRSQEEDSEEADEDLAKVCSYCIQDSVLCMKVFHKLKGWVDIRESATVFFQDTTDVLVTGQTQKRYTRFLRKAESMNYSYLKMGQHEDSMLSGGYVGVPLQGKHTNVITMDFASMYPSIIQHYNICMSTYTKTVPLGMTEDDFRTLEIPVEKDVQELPADLDVDFAIDLSGEDFSTFIGKRPEVINDDKYLKDVASHNKIPSHYQSSYIELLKRKHGGVVSKGRQEILKVKFVKAPPKDVFEAQELTIQMLCNEYERTLAEHCKENGIDYKPDIIETKTSFNGRKGVVPADLEELMKVRADLKKQMKGAKAIIEKARLQTASGIELDEETKKAVDTARVDEEMLDQRQSAVKVSMNSAYGCFGAMQGRLAFRPASAAITYCGRKLIEKVNQFVVDRGCTIVYNDTDSVMLKLPEPTIEKAEYYSRIYLENQEEIAFLKMIEEAMLKEQLPPKETTLMFSILKPSNEVLKELNETRLGLLRSVETSEHFLRMYLRFQEEIAFSTMLGKKRGAKKPMLEECCGTTLPSANASGYAYFNGRQMGDVFDPVIAELGKKLCFEINTQVLKEPLKLEFERVTDMLPLKKKQYMGIELWKDGNITGGSFSKGVVAIRGDTTPFGRVLYTEVLNMVLNNCEFIDIYEKCKDRLQLLLKGKVENSMLSVSKLLAVSYVSDKAPMKVFADYLTSIGRPAEPGTRLSLVVVEGSGSKSLRYRPPDTTEPIDYKHYHELATRPLVQLLTAAFPSKIDYINKLDAQREQS